MSDVTSTLTRHPRSPRASKRPRRRPSPADPSRANLYGKYAGVYDILCGHVFHQGRKLAIELLDIGRGDRVLEVGVGTGLSFKHYPRGAHITGIDFSPQMLEESRARLRKLGRTDIALRQGDVMSLDFPDHSFDKVLASHVLSAVPDPLRAWKELIRVCAPGGNIAVSNWFVSGLKVVRAAEVAMSPFTKRLGFILDLPLDLLTADPRLRVETIRRVNVPGVWRVVHVTKLPARTP